MSQELPRLHVITDEVLQSRYTHTQLAQICVDAGADGIQYREKRERTEDEHVRVVDQMLGICRRSGATLVVNDFVNVAIRTDAKAIHLGRTDTSIDSARSALSSAITVGGTANSLEEACEVDQFAVDYLGVGPVFGTTSKASPAPALGIERFREICDAVDHPVIAIGNIQVENVEEVLVAGAYGVAVLSAICCAPDVRYATTQFCSALEM